MKFLISILLIAGAIYVGKWFLRSWESVRREEAREMAAQGQTEPSPSGLPGFRPGYEQVLESSLEAAKEKGTSGLKDWLVMYRAHVTDPRLASIELDYVVMVGPTDRAEARRILAEIKARIKPTSPVYDRFRRLQKTYE